MTMLVPYRGLQVLDDSKAPIPGAGGKAINDDFKSLADRIGPSNYGATSDPTSKDNEKAGYFVGSRWYNTKTASEWLCIASTKTSAKWVRLGAGSAGNRARSNRTSGPIVETPVALQFGSTVSTDASGGSYFTIDATHDFTLANPTRATNGQKVIWEITQDGTGGRVVTFDSAFAFGSTGLHSTQKLSGPGKVDLFSAVFRNVKPGGRWYMLPPSYGY